MAARGQPNFGIVREIAVSVAPAPSGLVKDSAVCPPILEQHQTLCPLQHRMGDQLIRDGAVVQDNSPRLLDQNIMQAAQQPCGGATRVDPTGCVQYEDFAGILGERLVSGSLSDVSASTSDKIYSGYSSSGEHHGPRVKLMCSFGGKILPRPGDGKLRYAGGDTRIISVYRHTKYSDLMQKMGRLYGQPVILKYQLPNEDLDALISILCDEDVENMMDEYDRLQANEGSNRLRVFLFSPADHDSVRVNDAVDIRNTDQIYMDAINGMQETRPVSMVPGPLSCSNIMTGQQVPDTLCAPWILNNSSYALPVVSNTQVASALGQPVPAGMMQPSKQLLSRIVSEVSPPAPPSPTISSRLPQIRQPEISDAGLPFYGDQVLKVPATHLHELQGIDAVYQDDVGAGSGTSSLNSQQDGHVRHFDATRLRDSPTKVQYEVMLDHAHHEDQMVMADSMLPKVTPISGMHHPDSYSRLPREGSDRNLTALQQHKVDVLGPIERPSNVWQAPLEIQNLAVQDHRYLPHSAWQQPRQEGFQRLRPVRLSAPENMQGLAVACQQLCISQCPSPVINRGHEVAAYNQLDPSGGVMGGLMVQKAPAIQTNVQSPGAGQVPVLPGSAPTSPRVKFQDMNSNHTGVHPVFAGCGGFHGGFTEQPSVQPIVLPQIEPFCRGLKPLNTRLNPQEELLLFDDQARQQLQSPLSKHQEIRVGPWHQERDHLQSLYSEGLMPSTTPPYTGGSPYREHLTAFSDQRLLQAEGQEQIQHDHGFAANSDHQEGIDWMTNKPQNEKQNTGWTGLGDVDLKGQLSLAFNTGMNAECSAAVHTVVPSLTNPLPSDVAYFDSHVPAGASFMPAVGPQTILTGVNISNSSTYLPSPNEVLLGNPNVMDANTEGQIQMSAPLSSANISGNVNSLFGAEGQWGKGIQADARISEESKKLSIENTIHINDMPFLGGRLSRRATDKDICSPDEPFRSPVAEDGNVTVSRSKPIDTFHIQVPASLGTANLVELNRRQHLPLSMHISAGNSALGSHSLSLAKEASTISSCLTEVIKDYNCGDFVSFIPRDDLELSRPEFVFSDTERPSNMQYVSLVTSSQVANTVDVKDDLPIFDSDSLEESGHEHIRSSRASVSAEVDLLPSSLYTAPTLSMQNWEATLATTRAQDLVAEKNPDLADNIELHFLEKDALEGKEGKALEDEDGNTENANPAAIAEAEAVARGLQTIKNADLEELRELGTGTFGTVFYGKWRGTDVAIKRIKSSCFSGRPSERDRLIAEFWKEAYILGQLHHPNVVAFYGVVPDGPGGTLATVTEYMVNGSLKQVLQKKDRTIDRRKRLLIIMDAAFGMEYLHGKNIVHFDLKCENLLVNMKDPQRPICKVGDLGLSKVKHQTMVSGGVRGTLPWMAPELLNGSSSLVSEKVDVFSFGIVMWELLTGEEPYANMHYGAIIGGIVNNTLRPPIPSWCDPSWKALMEKCWSADPGERPAFLEISAELRNMANARQGQVSGTVSGHSSK